MKKLFLAATTVLLFAACTKTPGPGDIVVEMNKKICAAKSIKPALEFVAPDSAPLMAMVSQMYDDKDKGPKLKAELIQRCERGIKVKEEKIDGDTAVVMLHDDTAPTTLRKIDGQWKVTISKNDKDDKKDSKPAAAGAAVPENAGKDAAGPEACIDRKLAQVRKEIGQEAAISRSLLTEIEESCGVKN